MAFLMASSLMPWLMIAGDFMASADWVPALVSNRIEGDFVTSTAVASLPPFNIAEGDLKTFPNSFESFNNLMMEGDSSGFVT